MKSPKDVEKRALIFYNRNHRAWLTGDFIPLAISLQPPTGRQAENDDGHATKAWMKGWEASRLKSEKETRKLGFLGTYEMPVRVVLTSPEVAADAAGKLRHWKRITGVMERLCAGLGEEVREPLARKLAAWMDWDDAVVGQYIAVVKWLRTHDAGSHYIRELPIFGVDSKWLESHQGVVEAVVGDVHFKKKPAMVELRSLDASISIFGQNHLACELGTVEEVPAPRVLLVENHLTFLALPMLPGTVAMYGGGHNAHSIAHALPWLATKDLLYWGDLDSHGFHILDLLRRYVPNAKSIMMDISTAQQHEALAVEEPVPSRFLPESLSDDELRALQLLRDRSAAGCLRIEQERIPFDYVQEQLSRC